MELTGRSLFVGCFSNTNGMVLPFKMRLEAGEVADGLATITPGIVVGCKQKFKGVLVTQD